MSHLITLELPILDTGTAVKIGFSGLAWLSLPSLVEVSALSRHALTFRASGFRVALHSRANDMQDLLEAQTCSMLVSGSFWRQRV